MEIAASPARRPQAGQMVAVASSAALHVLAVLAAVVLARPGTLPAPEPWVVEVAIEQAAAPAVAPPAIAPPALEAAVGQAPQVFEPTASDSPLAIDLPPPEEVPEVVLQPPPEPPRRKPAAPPMPAQTAPSVPQSGATSTAAASPPAAAAAPQAAPATAPVPPTPSRYGAVVLAWLERYRDYPRAARLRRQEGEVLLRLTIDRAGRLLAAEIARTSGFASLDQAALDTARRAAPLPPLPADQSGDRAVLLVPVRFALAGGGR